MHIESSLSKDRRQIVSHSPSLALQAGKMLSPKSVWNHLLKMDTWLQMHKSNEL